MADASPDRLTRAGRLRDELEPEILPRQLRALEAVAGRLERERPVPDPAFVRRLSERLSELDPRAANGGATAPVRALAAACVGSGSLLLLIAAAWVALGG
jgi:hypothetical protein